MSDKDTLLSMGFAEAQVTKALRATKNSGLSPACVFHTSPKPHTRHALMGARLAQVGLLGEACGRGRGVLG